MYGTPTYSTTETTKKDQKNEKGTGHNCPDRVCDNAIALVLLVLVTNENQGGDKKIYYPR
jgi:hypothetical protein